MCFWAEGKGTLKNKWLIFFLLIVVFAFALYLAQQKEDYSNKIGNFKKKEIFIKQLYSKNSNGTIVINEDFSKKYLNQYEIEDMHKSVNDINKMILSGEVELDDNFQFKNVQPIEIVPVNPIKSVLIPLPKSEHQ
jgi:hypothetical protein